ncbi:glycosyltransferase family 25 protein [Sporocytophaga myxococcoides]|uniref:glycosyltransferase family 25 protein n=1 Tax=Sporocytophaga myxococcoides TaxID=153721 RepID=UPI00048A6D77|nr:glycosyltransferase family 25 protein [Sporocytophaga myxococcoides]
MFQNYFDHTYLINLKHRKDRLDRALSECKNFDFEPEIITAVYGKDHLDKFINPHGIPEYAWNSGSMGLSMTTAKIIQDAKLKGYKSILILEDDVEFNNGLSKRLADNFHTIPSDWEMILMGGAHLEHLMKINFHIYRVQKSSCLHCYAIKETCYDFYLEQLEKMDMPIDHITMDIIQPRGKTYCFFPNMAYQRPSYSDIAERKVDYSFLR